MELKWGGSEVGVVADFDLLYADFVVLALVVNEEFELLMMRVFCSDC